MSNTEEFKSIPSNSETSSTSGEASLFSKTLVIFDFDDTLPVYVPEDDDYEVCVRCGKHGPTDHMGLCSDCQMRYKEFVEKDD